LCFISKYKININHLPSKPRIDYETDPSLKKRINQWWESNFSLPPLVSMKTDRMETSKKMILNGFGYGFVPYYSLTEKEKKVYIYYLKNDNNEKIYRVQNLIYKDSTYRLAVVKEFVKFLKNKV